MLGWPKWVGIVCEDLQRQRTFYRDVLGMKERGSGTDYVLFDVDGDIVELLARSDAPQYAARCVSVGFAVEDIRAAREELVRRGVESVTRIEGGPADGQYWTYWDTEGNLFELVQVTGG